MRLPHRWSLDCNYLLGLTLNEWWALLRENDFAVAPAYWHRAVAITAMGAWNSSLGVLERVRLGHQLAQVEPSPPVFVIGHWRSGTTWLYQLLTADERYCFPNAYQVVNPHNFVVSEGMGSRLFGGLVPASRPPDQVALGFDLPEQDEYTLALASRCSPYVGHVFPDNAAHYERFLSMRDVTPDERERFCSAHQLLLRKLTLVHDKPAILKSPSHTARIRLLRELYPEARFLFIHRDPFTVFQSTRQLYNTLHWYWYLQRPDPDTFDERILARYVALHDAYFEDAAELLEGQLYEIAYGDLVENPVSTLRGVYEGLNLGSFEAYEPSLQARLDGLRGYRTNTYAELDPRTRERVIERWQPTYARWGYASG